MHSEEVPSTTRSSEKSHEIEFSVSAKVHQTSVSQLRLKDLENVQVEFVYLY